MPLASGASQRTISRNIEIERRAGKPEQQAIAIAENNARKTAKDEENAHGKLSEAEREEASRSHGEREEQPSHIFLEPGARKYPVKDRQDGEWKYSRDLLLAAAREARMHGHEDLASRADEIREREFGEGAKDCSSPAMDSAMFALDRAMMSARTTDLDGHMRVKGCLLTKAMVNPYAARELEGVPGASGLDLQSGRTFELYRDPDELKKAVASLEGKPLLIQHEPTTADTHPKMLTVGTVSNPTYSKGEIHGDLIFWTQDGIDAVENGRRSISCGYRYRCVPENGTAPDGSKYNARMVDIQFNHVAIVTDPRVPGAVVADSREALDEALIEAEWNAPRARALMTALTAMVYGIAQDEQKRVPAGHKGGGQFTSGGGGGASAGGKETKKAKTKSAESEGKSTPKVKEAKAKEKDAPAATKKSAENSKKDLTTASAASKSETSQLGTPSRVTGPQKMNTKLITSLKEKLGKPEFERLFLELDGLQGSKEQTLAAAKALTGKEYKHGASAMNAIWKAHESAVSEGVYTPAMRKADQERWNKTNLFGKGDKPIPRAELEEAQTSKKKAPKPTSKASTSTEPRKVEAKPKGEKKLSPAHASSKPEASTSRNPSRETGQKMAHASKSIAEARTAAQRSREDLLEAGRRLMNSKAAGHDYKGSEEYKQHLAEYKRAREANENAEAELAARERSKASKAEAKPKGEKKL